MQREASEQSVDDRLVDLEREAGSDTKRPTNDDDRESSSRLRRRLAGLFSVRTFLLAFGLALGGVFVGGLVPVVGLLGRVVGLALAGFAVGIASNRRRYLEVALAGAFAAAIGSVVVTLTTVFLPFGVRFLSSNGVALAGVGAGVGVLAALVGYYIGRDLRDGFTREL